MPFLIDKFWANIDTAYTVYLLAEPVYFICCSHSTEMHLFFTTANVLVCFLNLVYKKQQHSIRTEATEQCEGALCSACVAHLGWMVQIFEVAWGHLAAQWELGTQRAATFAQCCFFKEVQREYIGRLLFPCWRFIFSCRLISLWLSVCGYIHASWLAD